MTIPLTVKEAKPSLMMLPGLSDSRSATSRPIAASPGARGKRPPPANATLPATGQPESTPDSSTSTLSPLGTTRFDRKVVLAPTRPSLPIAASSAGEAARCDTVSARSPPSISRPLSAMVEPIALARLVTEASPATASDRHTRSSHRLPQPPRRSRRASAKPLLKRFGRRRCARCGRRGWRRSRHA